MAKYKTCPDCGANLDFGEKCDCNDKEKGLPRGNEGIPKKSGSSTSSIISRKPEDVNPEPPKELPLSRSVQSPCERSGACGVRIHPDAMDALYAAFPPSGLRKTSAAHKQGLHSCSEYI